jgi:hypothetical protein
VQHKLQQSLQCNLKLALHCLAQCSHNVLKLLQVDSLHSQTLHKVSKHATFRTRRTHKLGGRCQLTERTLQRLPGSQCGRFTLLKRS